MLISEAYILLVKASQEDKLDTGVEELNSLLESDSCHF